MTVKLLLAAGALLVSTSAYAQSATTSDQTADDLVCQLSGDCGGLDQAEATRDKPESRGFAIARRTSSGSASNVTAPSSQAKAARSNARIAAEGVRPAATAAKPGRSRTIAANMPRTAPGRADLRVTFVTGSAELTDAGRREADKFLTALAAPSLSAKKFRIEGHTDSVGSRDFNLDLSKRRAQSVVDYLVAHGADKSRFTVAGYGFDKPLPGLGASAGANRRVEVVVAK
jgi:outer membrane protein OmpA-like peptidoglycan-associated protein